MQSKDGKRREASIALSLKSEDRTSRCNGHARHARLASRPVREPGSEPDSVARAGLTVAGLAILRARHKGSNQPENNQAMAATIFRESPWETEVQNPREAAAPPDVTAVRTPRDAAAPPEVTAVRTPRDAAHLVAPRSRTALAPGAASASESWLQLDGTGMMPEAQERKRSTTAHTNSLKRNLKEKFSAGDPLLAGDPQLGSPGVKRKREPCLL